jgi:hydroxymethylglutaryl-CoA lyase
VSASVIGIVEVSPRDGLQNEARILPTASKVELLERCVAAGARRIEAVSFARPSLVPQMADAEAVMAAAPRRGDVSYTGLVLNERGLDRALATGVDEINFVVPVTDTFCERNQGTSVSGLVRQWSAIAPRARAAGLRVTATIAVAFGCPFEGQVAAETVAALARRLTQAPLDELALADTIGIGTPSAVMETAGAVVSVVADAVPGVALRGHFHDTYGRGIANALAAARSGIGVLDASAGGVGGCPFAPGAAGNVATEDLVAALRESGAVTSVDVDQIAATGAWLLELLGKPSRQVTPRHASERLGTPMERIWWQSLSAMEWAGPYQAYLTKHAEAVLDGAAEFHLSGLPASTFGEFPPMGLLGYPLASHVLSNQIPSLAFEAQEQGYSAFVLASYSEPHLRVVRSAVDISVVSVAESTLFAACSNAERIGIVAITPQLRRIIADIVSRHGLTSRVAHIAVLEPVVLEHELADAAFSDPSDIAERFERAAAECAAAQADLVIPGEGILSEVIHSAGMRSVRLQGAADVPVMDCLGVTLLHTLFQISAAKRASLTRGRMWSYPKLPADKEAFIRGNMPSPSHP